MKRFWKLAGSVALGAALWPALATGQEQRPTDYFVAVDGLPILATGTFAGLPNPNFGRLTLLVAHRSEEDPASSHFHAIGAYGYVNGEGGGSPLVIPTSANNRIPEPSTGQPPLPLHRVQGAFRVSAPNEAEYSLLRIESLQALAAAPAESVDGVLFRSSAGRWTTPLGAALVALQRISLTPPLRVSDESGERVLRRRLQVLGEGDALSFFPVYAVPRWAEPGTYSATLKLVDLSERSDALGESGRFSFDFAVRQRGDLDADNDVDSDDLVQLDASLGQAASGEADPRDLQPDGVLDAADRRALLRLLGRS